MKIVLQWLLPHVLLLGVDFPQWKNMGLHQLTLFWPKFPGIQIHMKLMKEKKQRSLIGQHQICFFEFSGNFFYFALHALCWWHTDANRSVFVWGEQGIRECRRAVELLFIMMHTKGNVWEFYYLAYLCTEYSVPNTYQYFFIILPHWLVFLLIFSRVFMVFSKYSFIFCKIFRNF